MLWSRIRFKISDEEFLTLKLNENNINSKHNYKVGRKSSRQPKTVACTFSKYLLNWDNFKYGTYGSFSTVPEPEKDLEFSVKPNSGFPKNISGSTTLPAGPLSVHIKQREQGKNLPTPLCMSSNRGYGYVRIRNILRERIRIRKVFSLLQITEHIQDFIILRSYIYNFFLFFPCQIKSGSEISG